MLVESIKIFEGKAWNVEYHNYRMNKSRRELFGVTRMLDLNNYIKLPAGLGNGLYKLRVLYDREAVSASLESYAIKSIRTLIPVINNSIEYLHKYEDREEITKMASNSGADDIIIIKNGRVTDSSFANIVFYDGQKWITPNTFLLEGTQRKYLLNSGLIYEDEIKTADLKKFKGVKLINALRGLNDTEMITIGNILRL